MKTLDALLPANSGERRTLADIIFAKLDSGEVRDAAVVQNVSRGDHGKPDPALGLNPKVVEVYTKCVVSLSTASHIQILPVDTDSAFTYVHTNLAPYPNLSK
jgi:essential nuclear protein 1